MHFKFCRFSPGYILLILVLFSCNMRQPAEHSFYYWKTSFVTDTTAKDFIKQHHVKHIYIHYMDVDWNYQQGTPVPRAELSGLENATPFLEGTFTPVVFITNKTFEKIDKL